MKLTGSLIVCAAAGLFTAGALILDEGPDRTASSTPPSAGTQIEISGFAYAALAVPPGSAVVAANRDAEPHTVTAADGSFDSGPIGSGNAVTFVAPTTAGTYQIVCTIHPSMRGELVVT